MTLRWPWGAKGSRGEAPPSQTRGPRVRWGWVVLGLFLVGAGWVVYVSARIRFFANHDEAQPADAIAVFGAAEYDGRPSPVLRARLMHGLALYRERLAPLIITLGGGEAGEAHSEGGVGEDFLLAHGVPEKAIIAETRSRDTRQSARQLAIIARENGLHSIIVVSDGTHLFRIAALCHRDRLRCYTSPRPETVPLPLGAGLHRLIHEVLSYTAWRVGLLR